MNPVKKFLPQLNAIWLSRFCIVEINVTRLYQLLARSEAGSSDARGLSLFLVERDETMHIRRIENKLGIHSSPTCEIQYNNTPAELVGKRRFGLMRYAMALMNGARLAVGAQALGIAEAAYRESYQYAQERCQFNQPIANLPAVARLLLSMRGEIEAARALIYETGRWVDLAKAYDHHLATAESPIPAAKGYILRISMPAHQKIEFTLELRQPGLIIRPRDAGDSAAKSPP